MYVSVVVCACGGHVKPYDFKYIQVIHFTYKCTAQCYTTTATHKHCMYFGCAGTAKTLDVPVLVLVSDN